MILIEDILFIIFLVLLIIVFVKWVLPVLNEEIKQAKKRTELIDLKIKKNECEIDKNYSEIKVLTLIENILLNDDFCDIEDFEDYE